MTEEIYSPKFSLKGWDLYTFIKGRKRMAVTILGSILGYVITNNETVAFASGAIVEAIFAVIDYYLTQKGNKNGSGREDLKTTA